MGNRDRNRTKKTPAQRLNRIIKWRWRKLLRKIRDTERFYAIIARDQRGEP